MTIIRRRLSQVGHPKHPVTCSPICFTEADYRKLDSSDLPHTKLSLLHARCGDVRHELNPVAAREWTIGVDSEAERDGLEVVTVATQWT